MKRPSPALVLSALALFVSLTGFGVAATGSNFILGHSNSANATGAATTRMVKTRLATTA